MLRVTAVKRTERKDRFYCVRADGSEASWAVASAPGLPHDLHHLVVESVLGLRRAFWGMVADGMEPSHVRAVTDHLERAGERIDELLLAEAAVADLGSVQVSDGDAAAIRTEVARLADEWERLAPGRGMDLTFG